MSEQAFLNHVVFIDSAVPDIDDILASLEPGTPYYLLDTARDGLQQMADILSDYSGLDSIHLISHGSPGSLQLGSSFVTQDTLADYSFELTAIGNALSESGDLLLYGCNVAAGETGVNFITNLALATHADVAASTNPTGALSLGGDWVLEANTGPIKAEILDSTDYAATLGLALVENTVAYPGKAAGEQGNDSSFAALRADGSVVTWGLPSYGGDSSTVAGQLDGTVDVKQIFSSLLAFAALRVDGSVVTWGDGAFGGDSTAVASQLDGTVDVTHIFSTYMSFAALRADGSVVTWGLPSWGGDSSSVAGQLSGTVDVIQIFSTGAAFAALRVDGSVVTWGDGVYGGDSTAVAGQLDGTVDVTHIFPTDSAFAALRADGSVVTWGASTYGGNSGTVAGQLNGTVDVTHIFSTSVAFAALRADGSVVSWGSSVYSYNTVANQLNGTVDVTHVFSTDYAFAALRADGSVITWGSPYENFGGNSGTVASQLDGTVDVIHIFSTENAFAALRADGSVVTWGLYGGDSSAVAGQLDGTVDVAQIFSTGYAFAALRVDGTVVTWGEGFYGGDSSAVANQLDGTVDVTQIFSTRYAFAALRADGSVVTWGEPESGGDSSAVTSELHDVIYMANPYTDDIYTSVADTLAPTVATFTPADGATGVAIGSNIVLTFSEAIQRGSGNIVLKTAEGTTVATYEAATSDKLVISGNTLKIYPESHLDYGVGYTVEIAAGSVKDLAGNGYAGSTDYNFTTKALYGELLLTMAEFSRAAYHLRGDEPLTDVSIDPHAYRNDPRATAEAAYDSLMSGWDAVDIPDLAYLDGSEPLDWSTGLKDGIYTNQNAAALVAKNGDTLVLAFRGTNDAAKLDGDGDTSEWGPLGGIFDATPDRNDWDNKSSHYDLLQPLDDALDDYIALNGITKVYVTGHSLGAAMVDKYMYDHEDGDGTTYQAFTFASPGYFQSPLKDDERIANFWLDDDAITNSFWFVGSDDLTNTLGDKNHLHVAYDVDMDGGDIHSMDLYLSVIQFLNENGIDTNYLLPGSLSNIDIDDIYLNVSVIDKASSQYSPGGSQDTLSAQTLATDPKALLVGGAENDTIEGGDNSDICIGGAGNDTIDGGLGADTMLGGAGNDTYVVDNTGDKVYESTTVSFTTNAGGKDLVKSLVTFSLSAYKGVTFVEKLTLTGTTAINGTGNGMSNTLLGNAYANKLAGLAGTDTLKGNGGSDTLNGGTGKDILFGGAGNDFFVFNTALNASTNIDTIKDYTAANDTIRLENSIFTSLTTTGVLSAANFVVGTAAADANDYLVYNNSTGALYYDADANGAGGAVKFATVYSTGTTPASLSAAEFVVI